MNNNPKYRQEWILDSLKENPTISYTDMFAIYSPAFAKSKVTFDKDWLNANTTFSTYQEVIIKAKLEESIVQEKESVKRNILQKHEALEILTEIAQGKKKGDNTPSFSDRTNAIKTMATFEGWEAPKKVENTNIEIKPLEIIEITNGN